MPPKKRAPNGHLAADASAVELYPHPESVQADWTCEARRLAQQFARLGNWKNFRALLIHMLGMYLRLGGTMRLEAASLHAPARETTFRPSENEIYSGQEKCAHKVHSQDVTY